MSFCSFSYCIKRAAAEAASSSSSSCWNVKMLTYISFQSVSRALRWCYNLINGIGYLSFVTSFFSLFTAYYTWNVRSFHL